LLLGKGYFDCQRGQPLWLYITVRRPGADIHPLYAFLTDKRMNPDLGSEIRWNFNKFLIDRNGEIAARFASRVKTEDLQVLESIERFLKQED
jgi:glutathione peroxidase